MALVLFLPIDKLIVRLYFLAPQILYFELAWQWVNIGQ